MVIEKLRQKAKQEATAEAAQNDARRANGRARRARVKLKLPVFAPKQIIQHPRFVAILSVWGAALLGFSVLAVSSVDIARVSMVLGLGALGSFAKAVYAAIAAVIGALGAFVTAWLLVRFLGGSRRKGPMAAIAAQLVRPIDPVADLGSESLDAPLEQIPFSRPDAPIEDRLDEGSEEELPLATLDAEPGVPIASDTSETDTPDTIFELDALTEAPLNQEVHDDHGDHGLDFKAFMAVLEKETRGCEDRKHATKHARAAAARAVRPTTPASVAKLREAAPQDLSLMQLVERFAAALHEVQSQASAPFGTDQIARLNVERERALAEALKALELMATNAGGGRANASPTDTPTDTPTSTRVNETEHDLRNALSKLQSMGAAG